MRGQVRNILKDILGGRPSPSPQANPRGQRSPDSPLSPEQLEDMLGVGREPASSRQSPSQPQARQPQQREMPRNVPPAQNTQIPTDIFGQRQRQEPKINLSVPKPSPLSQNDQAVLLIRAMINSAKVDGEISDDEQKKILEQVGDTSPETSSISPRRIWSTTRCRRIRRISPDWHGAKSLLHVSHGDQT